MNTQRRIYEAVKARGYRDAWTPEQFIARNVAKMLEELTEFAEPIRLVDVDEERLPSYVGLDELGNPSNLDFPLDRLGLLAGLLFDDAVLWEKSGITAYEDTPGYWHGVMREELADMFVVLSCMAEALSEITGEPVNLADLALAKAERDVERGVRSER